MIDEIRKEVSKSIGTSDVSLNLLVDLELVGTPDFIREAISVFSPYSSFIRYIVVNANSGPEGIKAAVETTRLSKILVGSALDSLRRSDVNLLHGTYIREEVAFRFALMAQDEGAFGLYCSSKDSTYLSQYSELKDFKRVVYGVRPKWDTDHGTHKYVETPKQVMERGASNFVLGSTIRKAKNRTKAVKKILEELKE